MVLRPRISREIKINHKYHPTIKWVLDKITTGELTAMLRDLSGENPVVVGGRIDTIVTRYSSTSKNVTALRYYFEKMGAFGVDSIFYHPFACTVGNNVDSNVIATRIGRIYPRQQYLLGGHIDDISEIPSILAPGADDNAGGVIAGLIAAKYIKGLPFRRTIKFVAWNGEEQNRFGSSAYASEARARGDSILGYLNADMIGYDSTGTDSIRIYTANRPGSIAIGNIFHQANIEYSLNLRVWVTPYALGSDEYSFWLNNYEAICAFEKDWNPYWHTVNDRVSCLDTLFYTNVVKCMVATLLELAEPDTVINDVDEDLQRGVTTREILTICPNPAHGVIRFAINCPEFDEWELSIYDVTGRLSKGIFSGKQDAGSCHRIFNVADLPQGVYFLRLDTKDFSATKKIVLTE